MQRAMGVLALLALVSLPGALAVTPVGKVLEMLNEMVIKGKQEKHDEVVRFAAFQKFCDLTRADKARTIEAAGSKIEELTADVAKAEADAEQLGNEVAELDARIGAWNKESAGAQTQRGEERQAFAATDLDYDQSISAIERAIATLKSAGGDVAQAPAVLTELHAVALKAPRLSAGSKRALASLLQTSTATAGATESPEANAYEFQSQGVVDLLEKLLHRFTEEKRTLVKEEMNRRHAHEMLMQQITDDVEYAEETRTSKAAMKARRLQDAASASSDLAETKAAKEADESYLRDLTVECEQKSKDFESRQNLRAAELEAINKAIEIISSPEVAGAAEKHLPSALLENMRGTKGASALAQLRRMNQDPISAAQAKAATLLMQHAKSAKSAMLAAIAGRVSEDPFAKVTQLIKDLLARLMEEASQEADHKSWCDEELSTNKKTRDIKTAEADDLSAQVDELGALAAKLGQDISDLGDAISEINAALAEATAVRGEEKKKNMATSADAKAGQSAVAQAISILKEFYSKASGATSLTQQTPPETFTEPYKGMQGSSGGVIGMLEVIQSDFARLEAETEASEDAAERAFQRFSADSKKDVAAKDKELRHKTFKQGTTVRDLNEAKKDLEATQAELTSALDYYEKLKPSCIDSGNTYEDRVARRKEEIVSLQEALRILEGEDLA